MLVADTDRGKFWVQQISSLKMSNLLNHNNRCFLITSELDNIKTIKSQYVVVCLKKRLGEKICTKDDWKALRLKISGLNLT